MTPPRLPVIPLRLLLWLASRERRDELEGDLREGFARVSDASGEGAARRWLWAQVLHRDALLLRRAHRSRVPFRSPELTMRRYRERIGARVDGLTRDIGWAFRQIRRRPGAAIVVIVTLAIAIGANSAIYTVVDRVMLRPLPYEAPDELAMVFRTVPRFGFDRSSASHPDYADWKEQGAAFSDLAAYGYVARTRLADEGARQWVGYRITGNLLPLLGVSPAAGRGFSPDDDRPGAPPVAILSHALYRDRFGADPSVIGESVRLDGDAVRVIGVMPEWFAFPSRATEFWEPLRASPSLERDFNFLSVIGRLAPGHTVESAQREIERLAARIDGEAPGANEGFGVFVEGRHAFEVRNARTALWVFAGAVGLLLLVACANIANVQMSRTLARRREIGVRSALGAGQRRLAGQLLTESVLHAAIGGVLGLGVAAGLLRILVALAPPGIPRIGDVALDGGVLLFTAASSILAGVAFGVLPALWGARQNAGRLVREGNAGAGVSRGAARLQRVAATAQIALAVALSIGAGLLIHSFARLMAVEPGFDPGGVLVARIQAPSVPEFEPPPGFDALPVDEQMARMEPHIEAAAAARDRFFEDVRAGIAAIEGVESAAVAYDVPFSSSGFSRIIVPEGAPPSEDSPGIDGNVVSPGYFGAMGIPLRAGRGFDAGDARGAPDVAIVNEALAESFWPGESAVGKRLLVGEQRSPVNVVGIAADTRQRTLEEPPMPLYYVPLAQETWPDRLFLVVKATLPAADVVSRVRREVAAVDPTLPLTDIATSAELLEATVVGPRFRTLVLATFGGIALLLAAVGLYGVIAHAVGERTREMGIRMALGAGRGKIVRLVLRGGVSMAAVGVALGVLGALVLTRFLESMLYGVDALEVVTFAVTIALATGVTLLACLVPARRAARVDPVESLRYD